MREGCSKADKSLGHSSSCLECPFDQCHLDDKGWASAEARWPGRMLLLWYHGKGIQDIAALTGASESTVKRSLQVLDPPLWEPAWHAWWHQILLEQHAEGRPMHELVRIFKLSENEINNILKEESGSSTRRRIDHSGKQGLSTELLDTPEYERWHKSVRQMRWVMEGDPYAVTEGAFERPWEKR